VIVGVVGTPNQVRKLRSYSGMSFCESECHWEPEVPGNFLIDSVAYLLVYEKTFKNTACACYSSAAINRADTVIF